MGSETLLFLVLKNMQKRNSLCLCECFASEHKKTFLLFCMELYRALWHSFLFFVFVFSHANKFLAMFDPNNYLFYVSIVSHMLIPYFISPPPLTPQHTRTFAKNDFNQAVHALAGSTMNGTRPGLFANTRAFSCAKTKTNKNGRSA